MSSYSCKNCGVEIDDSDLNSHKRWKELGIDLVASAVGVKIDKSTKEILITTPVEDRRQNSILLVAAHHVNGELCGIFTRKHT